MIYHRLCFSLFAVCLIAILPSFECTGIDPAPATVKASEGTVVFFGCVYSSNPNAVPVWEINGQRYSSVFPDGHSQNATGLVVLANKQFNGYRYQCHFVVSTNGQYQPQSSVVAYLYVNSYEIFNVTVSQSAVQNMVHSFVCTVSVDCFGTSCTSNQATIEWFHNGATPTSSNFVITSTTSIPAGNSAVSTSTITTKGNATVVHAGVFNCRAKLSTDTSYIMSLNTESLSVDMPHSQVVVSSSTVDIGTSATLSCTATPPPSVSSSNIVHTYQWKVTNGNSISGATSSTYAVNSATLASAGSYTCEVTSKYTGSNKNYVNNPSTQSGAGVLRVRINQPLSVQVPHVEADAGSNENLICNATLPLGLQPSLFTFTYKWLDKSNNTITGANESIYTVSGVSLSNGGIYTCNATAQYVGADAQYVYDEKLTSTGSGVLFVKASIKVEMNDIAVPFGQEGSFVCNVSLEEDANSVQVALLKGGQTLQSATISPNNNNPRSFIRTFSVGKANASNAAEYECHVQSVQYNNTLIKFLDNLMLTSDTAGFYVNVAAPTLTMGNVVGSVGSNINLHCRIDSVEPMSSVKVKWAKGGSALATNQSVKISDLRFESEYVIINAVAGNAGTYSCTTASIVYKNQYIISSNGMTTNQVDVHINPPTIAIQGGTFDLGQNATLQCTVTPAVAASQLTLNWTFGSQLLVEKTFNSQMSNYILMHTVPYATISDAGLYKCAVASIAYSNNNLSPLPVKSVSLLITVGTPTVTVNSLTKQIGSDVDMTCSITTTQSASSLTVKWKKGSTVLNTTNIVSNSATSFNDILKLKTVSDTDAGVYECEVSNIIYTNTYLTSGDGSNTATLKIKIPDPTVAIDVYGSTKVETSEIAIACVVVTDKPTTSLEISWKKDNTALNGVFPLGRQSSTKFITFYRINSATLSDSGVYKCQVDSVIYENTYLTSTASSDESNIEVINNPESTVPPVTYLVQLSSAGLKFWWKNTTAYGYKLYEYHGCQNSNTPRLHNIAQTCLSVDLQNIDRTPPNDFSIYSVQTCNSAQVCSSNGPALQQKNLIAFNFSDQSTLPSQPNQLIPWRQIHPRLVTQCGGLVVLGIYSSSGDYKEVTNYNLPSFLTQDSLGSTPITLSGSKLNDIKTFFDDQNLEWIRILEKCPTKSCLNDIVFNIGYQGYYHVDEQQVTPELIPSPCTIDLLDSTTPILSSTKAVIMTSIPPVIRTSVIPPLPPTSTTPSIIINVPTNDPSSALSTPMIALIVAVSIFVAMMFVVCLLISFLCLRRK